MRTSSPHVAVIVYHADETAKFLFSCRSGNVADSLNFGCGGLDAFSGNPVTKVFQFFASEEGLFGIDFESCVSQFVQDNLKFLQMVVV